MMSYIDGMLCAVPTAKRDEYRAFAERIGAVFLEYGALRTVDCWGDDIPEGKVTSMPMAVKLEDGESVVFSWVLWPSKEVRDEAWPKVMADSRMSPDGQPMPLDGKRMIFGGFQVLTEC